MGQHLQILREEGARGLFKGMGLPLATVAVFNAVLFAARGQMERLLIHEDGELVTTAVLSLAVRAAADLHGLAGTPFTIQDQALAGFGAGSIASLLSCPTELIKCRLQAQGQKAASSPGAQASPGLSQEGLARLVDV